MEKSTDDLVKASGFGSTQAQQTILIQCFQSLCSAIDDLKGSMDKNAKSGESLAQKVLWLNWVLAVAAVAGVYVALVK